LRAYSTNGGGAVKLAEHVRRIADQAADLGNVPIDVELGEQALPALSR
jgi:hypothetical protein